MKEDKIIKEILKGNQSAFRNLLEMYEHRVYHFVRKLVRDPHLAEDLTQETFLAVYRSLHTYDTSKPFSTWLFTIAKNKTFKSLRGLKQDHIHPLEELNLEDKTTDVLGQVIQSEEHLELLMAVDQLKASYKDVIIMRYFYDYSYREIGQYLGISVKKVENQLRAGKDRLHALLTHENGLEVCYDY